jgi:hypothetical protein
LVHGDVLAPDIESVTHHATQKRAAANDHLDHEPLLKLTPARAPLLFPQESTIRI